MFQILDYVIEKGNSRKYFHILRENIYHLWPSLLLHDILQPYLLGLVKFIYEQLFELAPQSFNRENNGYPTIEGLKLLSFIVKLSCWRNLLTTSNYTS